MKIGVSRKLSPGNFCTIAKISGEFAKALKMTFFSDCCGGGSITVHATGQTAEKYGSNLGTLEPSRTNEMNQGLPVYRNYGTHGAGVAILVEKTRTIEKTDNVWKVAFDFEPRDQHIRSHSSVGTSCPTSANWGEHSSLADTSFSSSFRDLSEITVKCSSDGQGTVHH